MPASSSRSKKVDRRKQHFNQTGYMKKAKRNNNSKPKFDTQSESDSVVRELGNRKKFHTQDMCNLEPKTVNQENFLRMYYEDTDLMMGLGASGSGKTFLALYTALSDILREDCPQDKIVLIRSAVQTREIGHLPGGLEGEDSKSAVFETPYHGLCRQILPKFKDAYTHLKSLGYLEFHLTSFLRGETFDRAIIIVDECQSMSYHELKTATERAGLHSRIVFCGDSRQDDLAPRGKKSDVSGLQHYLKVVGNMDEASTGVVEFTAEDVVRSGLAKAFAIADYKTHD